MITCIEIPAFLLCAKTGRISKVRPVFSKENLAEWKREQAPKKKFLAPAPFYRQFFALGLHAVLSATRDCCRQTVPGLSLPSWLPLICLLPQCSAHLEKEETISFLSDILFHCFCRVSIPFSDLSSIFFPSLLTLSKFAVFVCVRVAMHATEGLRVLFVPDICKRKELLHCLWQEGGGGTRHFE